MKAIKFQPFLRNILMFLTLNLSLINFETWAQTPDLKINVAEASTSVALRSTSQSFVKIGVNPHQIHPQKNRQMWKDGTWTGVDKNLLREIVMWKRQVGHGFNKTVFLSDSLENKLLNELHTVSKINFLTYLELNFGEMDDDVRNLFEVSFDHVTKNKFRFQGATNWWVNKYVGDGNGGIPTGRVVRQGSVYTEGQIRKVKRQIPNPI